MAYKRILVPVDGSRVSTRGLTEAIRLAKLSRGRLRLLHVVDEMVWADTMGAGTVELIEALRQNGQRTIRNARALVERHRVRADTLLVEEFGIRVSDVILREARKWRADLIVMGTHGRRGLDRMLLGSDADRVIRRSALPVLLVPPRKGGR